MKPSFSKWTQENVEKCKYLHPHARELFLEFLLRIAEEGIYVRIPDDGAMRTKEQQQDLYNRTPRVTWTLCPFSYHCHGLAIDLIPMNRIGPIWYKPLFKSNLYDRIAIIARQLNITWGFAEWGVDKGHFHYRAGKTIDQIAKGKYPGKPSIPNNKYHNDTNRVIDRLKNSGTITSTYFPYLYGNS